MGDKYILDGKRAVECHDLMAWAKWFETGNRRVADDTIGNVRVSTVFLSLDHSFGEGPPMLFETMVFGGPMDQEQDRCTTWDEAEAMHAAMVARVKEQGSNAKVTGSPALSASPCGLPGSAADLNGEKHD